MPYTRVFPRDLFNEAKLLKCLGQLALHVLEGADHAQQRSPAGLVIEETPDPLECDQDSDDGWLYLARGAVVTDADGFVELACPLNSREPYPLRMRSSVHDDWIEVFDDDGNWSVDFIHHHHIRTLVRLIQENPIHWPDKLAERVKSRVLDPKLLQAWEAMKADNPEDDDLWAVAWEPEPEVIARSLGDYLDELV